MLARLSETPCSFRTQARSSATVASRCSRTRSRTAACCASESLRDVCERCGRADLSPVRRSLCQTLITYEGLTSNCSATSRDDKPSAAASNTRSRRSCEYARPRRHAIRASGPCRRSTNHTFSPCRNPQNPDSSQVSFALARTLHCESPESIALTGHSGIWPWLSNGHAAELC